MASSRVNFTFITTITPKAGIQNMELEYGTLTNTNKTTIMTNSTYTYMHPQKYLVTYVHKMIHSLGRNGLELYFSTAYQEPGHFGHGFFVKNV
jgi:hypothetical protein